MSINKLFPDMENPIKDTNSKTMDIGIQANLCQVCVYQFSSRSNIWRIHRIINLVPTISNKCSRTDNYERKVVFTSDKLSAENLEEVPETTTVVITDKVSKEKVESKYINELTTV